MLWVPQRRLFVPRMPLGAARGAIIRDKVGGGAPATISLDGAQNFQNFNTAAASWTGSRTFTTATNLLIAVLPFEAATTVDSVAIDPAGANIALSQIGAGTATITRIAVWGVYDFTPQSGAKNVVANFNAAATAAGSLGLWGFKNATKLPTTGDFHIVEAGAGTSNTGSLTPSGAEEDGFILAGIDVNLLEDPTCGGGLVTPPLHSNQGAAGGHTCAFSHNLGPLSGAQSPSFAFSNARNCAGYVLVI